MLSNLRHLKAATQAVAVLALVCAASASPADTTTGRIPYRQALDQVNSGIKSQAGLLAILAPGVKTVVFGFDPTLGPVVRVHSNAGERSLPGDTNGIVRLELNSVSKDTADSVTLPAVPKTIAAE